jgi:cytoskeletal protein RodZ
VVEYLVDPVPESTVGAQLRRTREHSGKSLREIAVRTKISVTALEALERNDFGRLPGGIFGRAIVRAYATEIGADPDATVVDFVDQLERYEAEAAARGAVRPEITDDDRQFLERQRRAVLLLRLGLTVVVLVVVAVIVWRLQAGTS